MIGPSGTSPCTETSTPMHFDTPAAKDACTILVVETLLTSWAGVQERDQSSCGSDPFQIHQASTHRNPYGLSTPCNLQLFQDVRHVHFDSGLADV